MPYIGNTIRAADDYRLIDDISSGFNGSATSFALQVAGSAPVPFPKSPQQILVSVNGVIQEPDPTGASGFNLVGTNIVFSSAPTNGHAFFGIIYATADYLNSGGNFPSGSTGAPSLTFIGDEDTGIYRKGSGSVGFVSNSTEIANTDSNGITISSGSLILGDSSGSSDDRIKLGASGDLELFHDGSNSFLKNSTGNFEILGDEFRVRNLAASKPIIQASNNGEVQLYFNGIKKAETASGGFTVTGVCTATSFAGDGSSLSGINTDLVSDTSPQLGGDLDTNDHEIFLDDSHAVKFGAGHDLVIESDGTNGLIKNHVGGSIFIRANANVQLMTNASSGGADNAVTCVNNGAVELYYDNVLRFETRANDVKFHGGLVAVDNVKLQLGSSGDLQLYHDGSHSYVDNSSGVGILRIRGVGSGSNGVQLQAKAGELSVDTIPHGEVELYYDNVKKFETLSTGCAVTGELDVSGNIDLNSDSHKIKIGAGDDFQFYHDGSNNYIFTNNGDIIMQTSGDDIQLLAQDDIILKVQGGVETAINCVGDGAVELYHNNSKKLETLSNGVSVTGSVFTSGISTSSGNFFINNNDTTNGVITIATNTNDCWRFEFNGDFEPHVDNQVNIGSSTKRVANVFTTDLHLSNRGSQNDVDATWGDYTIQEGHEELFLLNHRTGKKFKFNLTEVS